MRIVFVGGGSGGHFYPLMAIAEAIKERDYELGTTTDLYYLGPEAYKQSVLDEQAIRFVEVPSGKLRRYFSWRNFTDPFKIIWGVFVAFWKLYWLYPDVVMSKGGYTSIPVVFAAWLLRIPIVIHESDALPGRANKFAARFSRYIGVAHDDVASHFDAKKVALVGMPIRSSFFKTIPDPYSVIGVGKDKPVVLVTGGSLGAEKLNNFVLAALPQLLPSYTVVHQTGEVHQSKLAEDAAALVTDQSLLKNYFAVGHLDQERFAAAMKAASLVITRAGSTTLFEIALLGKPAIVVPIPEDVSRDQRTNAYAYARSGGATVLEEQNLSDDILAAEIKRILEDQAVYAQMSQAAQNFTVNNAAYTLADALRDIGKEHE